MYAGFAGALLVFTGVWRSTEWMMDGRRRDTWALVPVGLAFLVFGYLIVMSVGGTIPKIAALLAVAAGGGLLFVRRARLEIRRWVIWTFIALDIFAALLLALAILG